MASGHGSGCGPAAPRDSEHPEHSGAERPHGSRNWTFADFRAGNDQYIEIDAGIPIAQGKSNAKIGIILGISARTVDKHLQSIYKILDVTTRTQAAIIAINKLVEAEIGSRGR